MGIKVVDIHDLSGVSPTPTVQSDTSSFTTGIGRKEVGINGKYNAAVKALVNGGASRIGAEPGLPNFDRNLAKYLDHTLLKADATDEEIKSLCEEAKRFGFASVCVNPTHVSKAAEYLQGTPVKVCTVIGFPLGATTPTVKAIETRDAIANGAEEVDMVINVGALKSGNDNLVKRDIEAVVNSAKNKAIVKVILETALLTKDQITKGCLLAKMAGADFVKTSTGFSTAGALVEDVALMRQTVGPEMGVKAAGGIRTQEVAEEMIRAGATRIGASASVSIVKGTEASADKY
ncbi:MAG: deoxyribose-phosphate aldolase [Candidatus Heimdallarchaeota archaeon]|nr:MAG: deoxyribose-phosphate aldolase [Candidatus Heimdallarchaeota archaeon]